jgi:ABC-2 type transport system ATP-binding protein
MNEVKVQAVKVDKLTKKFGQFVAVNNISFDVKQGEIFGFLGPNGSGKTTTIRMLCGILEPTSGQASVLGYDVLREPEKIKKKVGYMSQKFSLYPDLKVIENLEFFGGVYRLNGSRLQQKIAQALELAGLTGKEEELVQNLPIGYKQWLALSCALLHEPDILFLDEPTSGVDPLSRKNFWEFIYKLTEEGKTIFVTTHYMDEAEHCHRLALIHQGKFLTTGTPDEIKKQDIGRNIFEITCLERKKALLTLKKLAQVKEIIAHGQALRVLTTLRLQATSIKSFLSKEGIKVKSIAQVKPSLEDVFVSLMED